MLFIDRADAGRHLAQRLRRLHAADAVVLGLPRRRAGGVRGSRGTPRPAGRHRGSETRRSISAGRRSAVDDRTGRVPRLVVGISRSRASWWALAWAVGESRRRGMRLLLVHVLRPSALPAASTDQDPSGPPRDPFADDRRIRSRPDPGRHRPGHWPDARRRAGRAAGGLRTARRGACQTCPGRRPAGARMPAPRMAAPARARIGSAGLRAANGVPGRDRARTVAAGTFGALGDRLLPRPLVPLGAAARSTCSVLTRHGADRVVT